MKVVKIVNYMFCVFCHNFKKEISRRMMGCWGSGGRVAQVRRGKGEAEVGPAFRDRLGTEEV